MPQQRDAFGVIPEESYDFLDTYQADYKPEARGFLPGLEAVADGSHEFTIESAELKTANNGSPILQAVLVVNGGIRIQHTWWYSEQAAFNAMCADLGCLGFPVKSWGKQETPLKKVLPAAVKQMVGLVFRGAKTSRANKDKPDKPYQNLYINGLVNKTAMPASMPVINGRNGAHAPVEAPNMEAF